MFKKKLNIFAFFLIFVVCILSTNIASAEVFTRFATSGTFATQTNEDSLFSCNNSKISTYKTAYYDYFTVENTDLPNFNDIISIDYCIQGLGSINVGMNTERFASFAGDGSEQCFHANKEDYLNLGENIYLHNGYGLFGGSLNTDSSTDCLYVKINTVTPTPTNTPTPTSTSTPTPTNTPTATPTSTPIPTATPSSSETPTSTPTTATNATVSSSVNNEASSGISVLICNEQKPGSAPLLLLATSSGPNSITLNWIKAKDPVTYYLVTFGTKPGEQLYGNPNVGDSNTTSYTINNLSGGQNYYFKVRAGNDCMPGDYSNEVIGRLTGGPVVDAPEGFIPGVLGLSDEPSPSTTAKVVVNKDKTKAQTKKIYLKYNFLIIIGLVIGSSSIIYVKKLIKK